MENNKIGNRNKILLLIFMCIAWFLPYVYSFISSIQKDKWMQVIVVISSIVITTALYYVLKNRVLKLIVLLSAIVCVTVFLGYRYTLSAYSAFAVIYMYKTIIAEDFKNDKLNSIILALAPLTAIAVLVINFSVIISLEAETVVCIVAFAIIFLILMKCAHAKKTNTKAKRSNKAKELEKNYETLYKNIFAVSILGVLGSAASYKLNNGLTFSPWIFFIMLLIYEEDQALYSACEMIVNKIKAFVE